MCLDHPNRSLANGPNHPGPGPEEIPMVDVGLPPSILHHDFRSLWFALSERVCVCLVYLKERPSH